MGLFLYAQLQDLNVSLSRKQPHVQPEAQFQDRRRGYDTSQLRRQLGADPNFPTEEDRGILRLSEKEVWDTMAQNRAGFNPPNFTNPDGELEYDDEFHVKNQRTHTWLVHAATRLPLAVHFCLQCKRSASSNEQSWVASTLISSLFNDILLETDSPALALQASMTSAIRQAYYTWLPEFDIEGNSTSISFVDRLAPTSRRGFWAVIGIILVHAAVCTSIAVIFFSKTKYSLLGNAWPAISQVVQLEHAQALLQDGAMRTDIEVDRVIRKGGGMRKRYRTTLNERDDTVTVVSVQSG